MRDAMRRADPDHGNERDRHHGGGTDNPSARPAGTQPVPEAQLRATRDLVLESRLFGRARHSFDGSASSSRGLLEQAHGGTIFLANIGQIGHALQARLLHFLKHGEIRRVGADTAHAAVDVRVMSAADHRLFEQVAAGTFNPDLYYRLNVMHLVMPPVARRR